MIRLLLLGLLACGNPSGRVATYTGTIEVTEVDVAPLVPGRLETVLVRDGDRVTAGEPLFTLDGTLAGLEQEARRAAVEMARAAVSTVRAQSRAAQSQVDLLEREAARVRALEASGAGTAQQTSQVEGQLAVARAQAAAAREGVAQAEAGLAQAEVALRLADEKVGESSVVAPVSGVVLSRNREPGEVIGAGMSVVTLGDLDHPRLRVYVPLTVVERLEVGASARVRLDVEELKPLPGTITWIASEAEFTPRDILTPEERVKQVFAVDIALEPGPGLYPGIPADATFPDLAETSAVATTP